MTNPPSIGRWPQAWCLRNAASTAGVALAFALPTAIPAAEPPNFTDQVLPIFREKCCGCHNPDKKAGGLDLTSWGQTMAGGSSGEVIAPGDAAGSYLLMLASHESEPKMPPESDKLPAASLDVIKAWINAGAIERAGGKPVARKQNAIALGALEAVKPEGPPVMPPRLPLDPLSHGLRPTAVTALAASPHGEVVAVGGRRQVLLYHTGSLDLLGVLPFPEGVARVVRFSRNARLLLAGGGEAAKSGRVVVWDVTTGERVAEVGDEFDEVLAADLTADSRYVALGGPARVVRLLKTVDGSVAHEIRSHTDWVTALEFSPDGRLLASGDRAGNLLLRETRGGRDAGTLKGHTAAITAVAWRPDGLVLASVAEDGTARLWDPRAAAQLKNWPAHPGGAEWIAWLPDGRLVTTGRDRKVKLWKGDGGLERELGSLADIGTRVAATSDGQRVFAGDWTGGLTAFTTSDGKPTGSLDTNPPPLAERLAAAERTLAEIAAAEQAAVSQAEAATAAMQLAESQLAAARQALEESTTALEAARSRQSEAAQAVDRWRAEVDFAKQPVAE
ncbi:MAG: Chromosome partition protein Smc [Planctomycetota bacterium]